MINTLIQTHELRSQSTTLDAVESFSGPETSYPAEMEFQRADRRSRASWRMRKRVGILGIPVNNLTIDEAIDILDLYIQQGTFHQIATANVDFLIKAIRDSQLRETLQNCSMVLADGMPVVWASRLLRTPLRARATGADLVPRLIELAARKSYGVYLLGAEEEHSLAAAEWIRNTHPNARLVGRCSPPRSALEEMDHESILLRIAEARPDILLVAFGNPKQEKWLAMHRDRLEVPVCVGVGASLSFLSGAHRRAPAWMQNAGLEWLHRLCREPLRLAPRYFSNACGLLRYLSLQLLLMSTQRDAATGSRLRHHWEGGVSVVTTTPLFSGAVVAEFESLLYRTSTPGCPIVIDLSRTEQIGADAIGALISLGTRMQSENRKLWLVGASSSLRRVLRGSFLEGRFHFSRTVLFAARHIKERPSVFA